MFPGRQDGRRRWIHWAMAEPLHIILPKVYWNSFVLLWLPSWLCAWGDWNSRVPVLFRTRVWRRMRLPLWSSPSTGSWKFRGRSGRWQSRCRRIQNRFKTGLNRIRWSRHKNEILFVQNDESDGEMEVPRANELFREGDEQHPYYLIAKLICPVPMHWMCEKFSFLISTSAYHLGQYCLGSSCITKRAPW